MTNKAKPQKGRKKRKKDDDSLASESAISEIRVLGRKFVVTKMFWLRDKKHAFTTKVDESYNHLERFETDEGKIQGQLADLREILPEALRSKMRKMEKNGLADAVSFQSSRHTSALTQASPMNSFDLRWGSNVLKFRTESGAPLARQSSIAPPRTC